MAQLNLENRPHGLCPTDQATADALRSVPEYGRIVVDWHPERNKPHHNKLMAVLQRLHENHARSEPFETYRKRVMLEVGHVDLLRVDGKTWEVARSIAFDALDEAEFSELYDLVMDWAAEQVLAMPDATKAEIERTIESGVGAA